SIQDRSLVGATDSIRVSRSEGVNPHRSVGVPRGTETATGSRVQLEPAAAEGVWILGYGPEPRPPRATSRSSPHGWHDATTAICGRRWLIGWIPEFLGFDSLPRSDEKQ